MGKAARLKKHLTFPRPAAPAVRPQPQAQQRRWFYHVAFQFQLGSQFGTKRIEVATNGPLTSGAELGKLEQQIAQQLSIKVPDPRTGDPLFMPGMPDVVVLNFQLLREGFVDLTPRAIRHRRALLAGALAL